MKLPARQCSMQLTRTAQTSDICRSARRPESRRGSTACSLYSKLVSTCVGELKDKTLLTKSLALRSRRRAAPWPSPRRRQFARLHRRLPTGGGPWHDSPKRMPNGSRPAPRHVLRIPCTLHMCCDWPAWHRRRPSTRRTTFATLRGPISAVPAKLLRAYVLGLGCVPRAGL